MTGQPSTEDFIRLIQLLENYQFLVDVLLGHYNDIVGDDKLCQMCLERPRTGYKHCDLCKKIAVQRNHRKFNVTTRRQKRGRAIAEG